MVVAGDGQGSTAWTTVAETETYRSPVFTVLERVSRGPENREGTFSLLKANDWAVVIPYIGKARDGRFLMVRQYRHGSEKPSLEFPGGVIETGEDPARAAARELAEETGYSGGELIHAASVYPNPAIQGNLYHIFVSLNPEPREERNLDEHEVVDAFLLPARDIRAAMGSGELTHGLMACALFYAERRLEERGIELR